MPIIFTIPINISHDHFFLPNYRKTLTTWKTSVRTSETSKLTTTKESSHLAMEEIKIPGLSLRHTGIIST